MAFLTTIMYATIFHDWYLGDLKPAWLRHAELRAHTPDGFNSVAYRFYEVLKLQLPGFAGVDPSSGLLVTGVPGILSPLLTAAVSEETVVWDSVDGSLTFAPVTLGDSLEQMDQKATAAARPFVLSDGASARGARSGVFTARGGPLACSASRTSTVITCRAGRSSHFSDLHRA